MAPEPVVLSFEAGQSSGPVTLHPVGGQRFEQIDINGMPCVRMIRGKDEKNRDWYFDVDRTRCPGPVVDGELVIEQITSETEFRWLFYNSVFHEFHGFSVARFPIERGLDGNLFQLATKRELVSENLIRNVFPLRKAGFSRGLDFGADFKIHTDEGAFAGIHRLTLRLYPVVKPADHAPVDLAGLITYFFLTLFQRAPKAWEINRYEQAFRKGELWMFPFLQKMLESQEIRSKTFFALEKVEAIRQFYRLTCHRHPTLPELNSFYLHSNNSHMDFATRVFVEKHYLEVIEAAMTAMRKTAP